MTITEFLLARIAEDEGRSDRMLDRLTWAHRLRESAAKRAIIEQAGEVNALEAEFTDYIWRGAEPEMNTTKLGDKMIRTLAAVYSDHPDYNPDWAL